MAALEQYEDYIREKVIREKWTHKMLSDELQQSFSGERGFSVRSIERFCSEKEIRKTCDMDDQQLDEVITDAVLQVRQS